MPIIFQSAQNFWIESQQHDVTVSDAAGQYDSITINLERPGNYIAGAVFLNKGTNNDNTQAMAPPLILGEAAAVEYGIFVNGMRVRVRKQVGTAGDTVCQFQVLIFLRK